MKKLAMHWKILIGMIVGLLFGLLMKNLEQKGLLLTGLNRSEPSL
jgi:Na+/H+-dicarboxylate symporter